MSNYIITDPSEASRGSYAAVRKVTGVLSWWKRVPSRFATNYRGGTPDDDIEIGIREAAILEMADGEPEPELDDGEFRFRYPYAAIGKTKPPAGRPFTKGLLESAKRLGISLTELNERPEGTQQITVEYQDVIPLGFKVTDDETGEQREATSKGFVFVGEGGLPQEDMTEWAVERIVGKNPNAALRACLLDNRVKHATDVIDALRGGTISDLLPVKLDEETGLYTVEELPF